MTTIQIRNVPDELSRKLKSRAALAGMSLSEYLLRDLERSASYPSREELFEQIRSQDSKALPAAADIIRAERDSR